MPDLDSSPTRRRPAILLPLVAVLAIITGVVIIVRANDGSGNQSRRDDLPRAARRDGPPNVLVIMTDDQTLEAMRVMDHVDRYLVDQGTSFTNYFVAYPNCCPSRASFLTGQYNHNNKILENVPPAGGYEKFNHDEALPVWLQRSGYWTAHVGKYLNGFGEHGTIAPPKGYDRWYGLIDPTTYRYYGYSVSEDGRRVDFGERPEDYQTDVLGAEVVRIVTERATVAQPWFATFAPLAPHSTNEELAGGTDTEDGEAPPVVERLRATLPDPAPEFKGRMAREQLPRPPSFNEEDIADKPRQVQRRPRLVGPSVGLVREGYQRELESLLSVDKWVQRIFDTLTRTDQIDNTIVVFTSDNGYFHGEHRISLGKILLYEEAVHLPLIIRGPGFARAAKVPALASNVDLAPTILAAAGASPGPSFTMDGRDLGAVARDPVLGEGRAVLLQNWRQNGAVRTWGIRTDRHKYIITGGTEEELYDLQADPHELENRVNDPAYADVKAALAARLRVLESCTGATCEGADAAQTR
jgi:N-acetylglucosamine-6-sulfatase